MANLVSQALSRVYARRYRIGVPEWRVLVTLGQYGVMTGKDIGAHSHMHKTKVSRAVAVLEKRKLLSRRANRDDMRESFLSLTASGRAMYELALRVLDLARRLTDSLSPTDREAFIRALKKITDRSAELVAEADGETAQWRTMCEALFLFPVFGGLPRPDRAQSQRHRLRHGVCPSRQGRRPQSSAGIPRHQSANAGAGAGDAASGDVLIQSLAIIEYLDETHPEPALLPKDRMARAKVRAGRADRLRHPSAEYYHSAT